MKLDADLQDLQKALGQYDVGEVTDVRRLRGAVDAGNYRGLAIIIELRDHGPSVHHLYRFGCTILSEDGQLLVTGNGGPTVEDAIDSVHWQSLARKLIAWIERPNGQRWGTPLGD